MNLVLMGPPGSGKGTQASGLAAERGLAHIATGDILRGAVTAGTDLGRRVASILNEGGLVPDDVMMDLIGEHLALPAARRGWLMDGFPRTRAQASGLREKLAGLGQTIDAVVVLDVPDDVIVARISRRLVCGACGAVTGRPAGEGDGAGAPGCPRCGAALYQREDDREETVRNRLEVYRARTVPAEVELGAHYPLRHVNGEGDPRDVAERIRGALG